MAAAAGVLTCADARQHPRPCRRVCLYDCPYECACARGHGPIRSIAALPGRRLSRQPAALTGRGHTCARNPPTHHHHPPNGVHAHPLTHTLTLSHTRTHTHTHTHSHTHTPGLKHKTHRSMQGRRRRQQRRPRRPRAAACAHVRCGRARRPRAAAAAVGGLGGGGVQPRLGGGARAGPERHELREGHTSAAGGCVRGGQGREGEGRGGQGRGGKGRGRGQGRLGGQGCAVGCGQGWHERGIGVA